MVTEHLPPSSGNWASNEQNAIKAYRASVRPEEEPRALPELIDSGFPFTIEEHFKNRMVQFANVPRDLNYSRLGLYIRGGPLDTMSIDREAAVVTLIFLHSKDASTYKRYMREHKFDVNGCHLYPSAGGSPRLANMRLWDPERVIREGISRCIFLEGLPNGTNEYSLKHDLRSLNPAVRLEFESVMVEGVCARVATASVSMGNFIQRSLGMHPKYTGIRIRYEEDYSNLALNTIGKPITIRR